MGTSPPHCQPAAGACVSPGTPGPSGGVAGSILGRGAQPGAGSPALAVPCAARPAFCYRLLTPAGCGTNERGGSARPGLARHGGRPGNGGLQAGPGVPPAVLCPLTLSPVPRACRGKPAGCPALGGARTHTWWLWSARPPLRWPLTLTINNTLKAGG